MLGIPIHLKSSPGIILQPFFDWKMHPKWTQQTRSKCSPNAPKISKDGYNSGCELEPPPWFSLGSLTKNNIILVVNVAGRGSIPGHNSIYIYIYIYMILSKPGGITPVAHSCQGPLHSFLASLVLPEPYLQRKTTQVGVHRCLLPNKNIVAPAV